MNLELLLKQKIASIKAQPIEVNKSYLSFMFINDLFAKNPEFELSETKLVMDSIYQNILKYEYKSYSKTDIDTNFLKVINKNNKNALIWFYDTFIKDLKESQYFDRNIQLIKWLKESSLKSYLINHSYQNFSPEYYKNKVLRPLYSEYAKYLNDFPVELFTYYLENNQTNVWDCLKDIKEDVQVILIDKLICNQYFKSGESYKDFLNYTSSLSNKAQNTICEKVFSYEKNLDFIKVFENKFNTILQNKELNIRMIQPILNRDDLERRNYLFNKFFTTNTYLSSAINIVFIADAGQKKRSSLINFTDFLLTNHYSNQTPLNSEQFALIIKRSFHCGMFKQISEIMNGLYNSDKDLFHEVSNKVNNPLLTIKGYEEDIVLKFHINDMQTRFKIVFNDLLEQSLPEKEEKIIKRKI